MNADEIIAELTRILRDIIGDDDIVLIRETVREDIPRWDSVNYIMFMVATEGKFGVKFSAADIESFPNVGAVVDKIVELKGST
jgi:acyl carrier protein